MRKVRRVIWVVLIGVLLLAIGGAGAWLYVMSNVEKPAYQVVEQDGAVELRDYPQLIVAQVTKSGERKESIREGFRALAAYIFARDRAGKEIAMTAPVTQSPDVRDASDAAGSDWQIRFVMPSEYALEDLPAPGDPSVRLLVLEAGRRAAIRFSGVADSDLLAEHEAQLREWLQARGLDYLEPPTYAFYNDPFTPGPLRRNEVIFDLQMP